MKQDLTSISDNSPNSYKEITVDGQPTIAEIESDILQKNQDKAESKYSKKAILASCILPPYGLYLGVKLYAAAKKSGNSKRDSVFTILFSILFMILWPTLAFFLFSSFKNDTECSKLGPGIHKIDSSTTYVCQ